jgi:protein gp37
MAETTKIEWADATVSMWWGCTRVSEACRNCYAESWANRWGKKLWGPGAPRERKKGAEALARRLNRQAERAGRRLRVFSASMSDWLDDEVPAEWLADLLALVAETPHLDWLLLSKRPHLWRARLDAALDACGPASLCRCQERCFCDARTVARLWLDGDPPPNVWVGATVEDQERADERIPALLAIPAQVRFLSCEPLLGPLDLRLSRATPRLEWIIAGGESGRNARPSHPDWFRSLRDQAQAAGVAFFLKQLGGHPDKRGDIDRFPEDLRVREVPCGR